MSPFQIASVFIVIVAAGGWLNARSLKLPREVAMLLVGLACALGLWAISRFQPSFEVARVIGAIDRLDFAGTVLGYMLAFLLFAGAMQVDLRQLRRMLIPISMLATAGVCAAIVIVGWGFYRAAVWLGIPVSLPWALVFGALISPTDPIAVLAATKRGHLPQSLAAIMQGEALFNDGVAIVAFTSVVALAEGQGLNAPYRLLVTVFVEAAGGLLLGMAAGWFVLQAMRAVDDFFVESVLSIALCMGLYSLAGVLHLSGPIAVVGAGLLIGNERAQAALSVAARTHLYDFWNLIEEILNAVLFLLLGLELLVVPFRLGELGLGAIAVGLVLAARICVVAPWAMYIDWRRARRGTGLILTWGGLHGALSLALALSLPAGNEKPLILAMTYFVVGFSLLVQGLTFGPLAAAFERPAQ